MGREDTIGLSFSWQTAILASMRIFPLLMLVLVAACGRRERSTYEGGSGGLSTGGNPMMETGGGEPGTFEGTGGEQTDPPRPFDNCPEQERGTECVVPGGIAGIDWSPGLGGAGPAAEWCPELEGLRVGGCAIAVCSPAISLQRNDEGQLECCYESVLIHCR